MGQTPKECPNVSNIWDKNVGDKPCQFFKIYILLNFFQNLDIKSVFKFSIWNFEV